MDTTPGWRALLPALAMTAAACGTQDRLPLEPPSRSVASQAGTAEISGRVLGPDGTSICNSVPPQDEILVLAFPTPGQEVAFPEPSLVVCPDNRYSIAVEPGTYVPRADFLVWDDLDELPIQTVLPAVTIESRDIVRNIRIEKGTALRGLATVDGEPLPGVVVFPVYGPEFFLGVEGISSSNGRWENAIPLPPFTPELRRRPMILQNDLDYIVFGECRIILGTAVRGGFPFEPFRFPTERRRVDCELETGPTTPFTHNFNRIAVTPMPADIGGLSDDPRPDLGTGYGVQFPSPPRQKPAHGDRTISQLFAGGLLIGVGPRRVLSGVQVGGHMECPFDLENACRDLGLDGAVRVFDAENGRKTVAWRYSDAASPEGIGLRVLQRSFDAPAGNDYVLFQFIISNHAGVRRTINPGIFTDWDVDSNYFEDVGFTQRMGRLLSQASSEGGTGIRVGTLMIGDTPPTPGYFFYGFPVLQIPTLTQQIHALNGRLTGRGSEPGDLRYIQSVEPIALNDGAETTLWVAVVAGEGAAEFERNADAAAEDIRKRRRNQRQDLMAAEGAFMTPGIARASSRPSCGKECVLRLKDRRPLSPMMQQR